MGGASTSQTCGVGEANGPIRDPRVNTNHECFFVSELDKYEEGHSEIQMQV